MPFQHLLVATDLSPSAGAVHQHAADLAQALGARVTLLNVDETSSFNFAVRTPATHHRFAQLLRDASRQRALGLGQGLLPGTPDHGPPVRGGAGRDRGPAAGGGLRLVVPGDFP